MSGPLGSGESEWKQLTVGTAQRIVSDGLRKLIYNEFDTNTAASTQTAGTGTVTYDTGMTGGVVKLKTGAGPATSESLVYNAGGVPLIGSPLNESWYVEANCWIKNVPDVTTGYDLVAIQDTFAAGRQAVQFGLYGPIDATFLVLILDLGGPTTQFLTTVAAPLDGLYRFGVGRDVVNDKLYAMIDGEKILEQDGPFANLTANPCFQYSNAGSAPTVQDVELWIDHIAAVVEQG